MRRTLANSVRVTLMSNFQVDNFVGCIASGKISKIVGSSGVFDANKVLGTAFVIDREKGIILTCDHVLPKEDRESGSEFAFYVLDENQGFKVFLIDKSSAVQWDGNDVIALKLRNPNGLKTFDLHLEALSLGAQVTAIGCPLNHLESKPGDNHITLRAFVTFVVSGYPLEYDVDKQFIVTMSGSPVFFLNRIVGIAHKNKEYAINQYRVEKEEVVLDGKSVKRESYEYSEVSRYGVVYKASAWHAWLKKLT